MPTCRATASFSPRPGTAIEIAIIATIIATLLGTAASLALFRYEFAGKKLLQALLFPPIAIPWLITGTAMLIFFFGVGIGRGLHAILLGHVALALPYVIVVVSARLQTFAPELEEAARSLGASQWQVTMRVTLPWIMPGVIAGALFAFAVSFDQFVVSYFLSTPGEATLPVEIYAAIRKGFTPEINAVSTIIIAVSMGLMLRAPRASSNSGEKSNGRGPGRKGVALASARIRRSTTCRSIFPTAAFTRCSGLRAAARPRSCA